MVEENVVENDATFKMVVEKLDNFSIKYRLMEAR
jgi:hypothetical protein